MTQLRNISKVKSKDQKLFGKWNVKNINFHFKKVEKEVEDCLSLHKIRVSTVIGLSSLMWSDKAIMDHLNWSSIESLECYRKGINIAKLRGAKDLSVFYEIDKIRDKVDLEINKINRV